MYKTLRHVQNIKTSHWSTQQRSFATCRMSLTYTSGIFRLHITCHLLLYQESFDHTSRVICSSNVNHPHVTCLSYTCQTSLVQITNFTRPHVKIFRSNFWGYNQFAPVSHSKTFQRKWITKLHVLHQETRSRFRY